MHAAMAIVNRFPCIAVALPWSLYSSAMQGQIPEREVFIRDYDQGTSVDFYPLGNTGYEYRQWVIYSNAVLHESGMDSMLSRRLCERSRSTAVCGTQPAPSSTILCFVTT